MAKKHILQTDKSLLYGDCLDVMKKWVGEGQAEKIDLIYLDPPFNSNANYNVLYGKENNVKAQVIAFEDTWTWNHKAEERYQDIKRNAVYTITLRNTIDGFYAQLGESGMLSYLTYMGQRLFYCHKMLKETGSIYLHCDPTASHYLKILMDAIFGGKNFRNEVIWHYATGGHGKKWFGKKHDSIFFYSKGEDYHFFPDKSMMPRTEEVLRRISTGNPSATRATTEEKLPVDVWTDINALNAMANERTGYPTQKPVHLLERIVKVSSNDGDIVLDPFCGCGTTVVAANNLKRRWVGIDISAFTMELIKSRLHDIRKQINIDGIPKDLSGAKLLKEKPFEFEKWAITQIAGMLPNAKQVGDKGVDGEGELEHDIKGEEKPPAKKTPLVIAQVTVAEKFSITKFRDFYGTMINKKASFGVYIMLEGTASKQAKELMASAGTVKVGSAIYPRLQFWTIKEHFAGKAPHLPPLMTSRVVRRGGGKTKISQGDLDYQ